MANARILGKSWADDITLTATSEALAIEHLQDTDVRKVWRSTSSAAQTISGDFGEAKTCNGIHLENLNLLSGATIQLELSNDSGFTPNLVDTTFSPWSQDLTFKAATKFFTEVSARYMRITITDASGNPDGYVEVGRLKIGDFLKPEKNISFGASLDYEELGELQRARGGALIPQSKDPARILSCQWDWLKDAESQEVLELKRITGQRDDVVLSAYAEEGGNLERYHTVLGFATGWQPNERYVVSGRESGNLVNRSRFVVTVTESL